GTYLASSLIVFGAKAARKDSDGRTESSANGWDFLIGLVAPLTLVGITWGTNFFENYVLEKTAGGRWPETETSAVENFLPVQIENNGRRFNETGVEGFAVSLFSGSNG